MRVSKYYRGQWLTGPVMRNRLQKCKILLRRNHRAVLFTDEKLFTVERKFNRQNNRQLLRPGQVQELMTHPVNRHQLERFLIVSRPLKNFIDRYLQSKPYRIFDKLCIRGGSYALFHKRVQWHPNRDDYSIQQFLGDFFRQHCWGKQFSYAFDGTIRWTPRMPKPFTKQSIYGADFLHLGLFESGVRFIRPRAWIFFVLLVLVPCSTDELKTDYCTDLHNPLNDDFEDCAYYSFDEMRPYLGSTVRIISVSIFIAEDSIYNPEHITEMESITYLWRNGNITIQSLTGIIGAEDFLSILNSPTILQCRILGMNNANFSFKDYKVLYTVEFICIYYFMMEIDLNSWQQFLEEPEGKPVVIFHHLSRHFIDNLFGKLSKAFSSAVSPNAFKIVFVQRKKTFD
ncbi:hypothetical protein Ddc_22660 [Ditylenchus destructor]|nr:hypothetical protein Ddc_22660 [Ditylenchus destructor]